MCSDKSSLSHQSDENGDFDNCQIARFEETRGARNEPNDERSLIEILETVNRSANSGIMKNNICSGELIKDTNFGNLSNNPTITRLCSLSKYTIQDLLLTFRVIFLLGCRITRSDNYKSYSIIYTNCIILRFDGSEETSSSY